MVSFKTFLAEKAIGKRPQYEEKDLEAVKKILLEDCSDALWMAKFDSPLYRGDSNNANIPFYSVVDTSATKRASQNATNYYTTILDATLPSEFPRRSRSFICSTNAGDADSYAGEGSTYVLIPFNNVKIGIVGRSDIWLTYVKMFGVTGRINNMNTMFWEELNSIDPRSWGSFKKFDNLLKNRNKTALDSFESSLSELVAKPEEVANKFADTFLEEVQNAYSAETLGFIAATTKDFRSQMEGSHSLSTECWVGGKCLMMRGDYWRTLIAKLKDEKII